MAAKKEKIEVGYADGFIQARFADIDTTEGVEQTVAGVDMRIRCSSVVMYTASEPGVVLVTLDQAVMPLDASVIALVGSVAGMDAAMKRDRIRAV